jgi:signal transduction histidine kinase
MLNARWSPYLRAISRVTLRLVRPASWQFGVTGWLTAAVLVLVPLLAVLQYRWLGQLSEAEHERMQRTLTTAAQQLAREVDGELSKALSGLQVDAATLDREAWDVMAQRHDAWAASAVTPALVDAVYLAVDATPPGAAADAARAMALRVWDTASHRFEETAWPPALAPVLPALQAHVQRMAGHEGTPGRRERLTQPSPLGDARTLVSPIVRVTLNGSRREGRIGPPDMTLLGFTIITLDLDVLRHEVLPALVRRHLYDADGTTEYRIAVVESDDPSQVVFASDRGAADAVRTRHDASVDFLSARPNGLMFAARGRVSPPEERPEGPLDEARDRETGRDTERVIVSMLEADDRATTVQTRLFSGREGHWRLLVAHESGSLDAAVGNVRLRNLFLSSGILLLLTVAIGLIAGSARRAQALARQQMEFVAAVSHELRTPVAVINSAAGNLADGVVDDPARVKTYGTAIQTEARRLGETVERVLQLAGLDAGQQAMNGVVPAASLVHEAVEACRLEIDRHDATVEIDVAPDLPGIAGDAAALRSAVQNLVGNAVKYGGGTPWVRVSVHAGRGGRRSTADVLVTVEDRGLGIAAEDRAHVFEPFYRGRDAVARQIQGSGLGLSLVARIAAAHGGRVTLESEPGRGSRFTLHLPAAPHVTVPPETVTVPDGHIAGSRS